MRTIKFDGYIDTSTFWGDEITPDTLTKNLYGDDAENPLSDDVTIVLNSYGGDCNAATQMFDIIRDYPGQVNIRVSGTAASAATFMMQAADSLEITPGSMLMIHDPLTIAIGNENDMQAAIDMLAACKRSIINCYKRRSNKSEDELAALMSATTWMDAEQALANGLVDKITEVKKGATDALDTRTVSRAEAEAAVQKWSDRRNPAKLAAMLKDRNSITVSADAVNLQPETVVVQDTTHITTPIENSPEAPKPAGVSVEKLKKRLNLLK